MKPKAFVGKMFQERGQHVQTAFSGSQIIVKDDDVAIGRVLQQEFQTGTGRKTGGIISA